MRHVLLGILLMISPINISAAAEELIEDEKPNLEFLEFLGSFESENGQWLDPVDIEKMMTLSTSQIENEAEERHE